MGFINQMLYSMQKSRKLTKLFKRLHPPVWDIQDFIKNVDKLNVDAKRAIEDLLDLAGNDKNVKNIMNKYNVDRNVLREIYQSFNNIKGSRTTKGHLIKASAIVYPQTLDFLLRNRERIQTNYNEICNRIFDYFDKGEVGLIKWTISTYWANHV